MVNLAPFIGARVPSKDWIPCCVTAVDRDRIEVTTDFPFRAVTLWVAAAWVEARQPEGSEEAVAGAV